MKKNSNIFSLRKILNGGVSMDYYDANDVLLYCLQTTQQNISVQCHLNMS